MNLNENNSGELDVGIDEGESKYVTSAYDKEEKITSIAIIAAILALAIVTCVFFAVFTEESVPVIAPQGSSTTTTKPTTSSTTAKLPDPDPEHPYATITNKTQFVASMGGQSLENEFLSSEYAILINNSDMSTVGHLNADETIYPASMTKVMTVLVALDIIKDLDDVYIITQEAIAQVPVDASVAWLGSYVGESITVRDIIYGISYMSGADSVVCLLDYLNLTTAEFVALMNEKAEEIGLQNTTFGGAIGMDAEENQTTCRDVAAIMAYAMENPYCVEFFGGDYYRLEGLPLTYSNSTLIKTLNNLNMKPNDVLGSKYTLIAAKSGLEDKAGYCLVSYIKNNSTGEYFVLVTAKASKGSVYPANRNTIYDMIEVFEVLKP